MISDINNGLVQVVPYRDEYKDAFSRLNYEWIERYFRVEPRDREYLADPYGQIVARGGEVFFVLEGGVVMGTCAIINRGTGRFELSKMAVTPDARGRGFGDLLVKAVVDWTRAQGGYELYLLSASSLIPALKLYEKHGFKQTELGDHEGYYRADVRMSLSLNPLPGLSTDQSRRTAGEPATDPDIL